MLTGQHAVLDPADYGMRHASHDRAGLPGGQPDPHRPRQARRARDRRCCRRGAGLVIVQGDTSSALGGALRRSAAGIPVAHVEAGLRSHDRRCPGRRRNFASPSIACADLLFAPTELNAANLRREGLRRRRPRHRQHRHRRPARARLHGCRRAAIGAASASCSSPAIAAKAGARAWPAIATALIALGRRLVMSRSTSCSTRTRTSPTRCSGLLGGRPRHRASRPLRPSSRCFRRMRGSDLILSDSGGMQEEAPALGIPLLVLRDRTERPEGIASGNAILVGRRPEQILSTVEMLFDNEEALRVDAQALTALRRRRRVPIASRRSSRPGSGGANFYRHRPRRRQDQPGRRDAFAFQM